MRRRRGDRGWDERAIEAGSRVLLQRAFDDQRIVSVDGLREGDWRRWSGRGAAFDVCRARRVGCVAVGARAPRACPQSRAALWATARVAALRERWGEPGVAVGFARSAGPVTALILISMCMRGPASRPESRRRRAGIAPSATRRRRRSSSSRRRDPSCRPTTTVVNARSLARRE